MICSVFSVLDFRSDILNSRWSETRTGNFFYIKKTMYAGGKQSFKWSGASDLGKKVRCNGIVITHKQICVHLLKVSPLLCNIMQNIHVLCCQKESLWPSQALQCGKMSELEFLLCHNLASMPKSAPSTEGQAGVGAAWDSQSFLSVREEAKILTYRNQPISLLMK